MRHCARGDRPIEVLKWIDSESSHDTICKNRNRGGSARQQCTGESMALPQRGMRGDCYEGWEAADALRNAPLSRATGGEVFVVHPSKAKRSAKVGKLKAYSGLREGLWVAGSGEGTRALAKTGLLYTFAALLAIVSQSVSASQCGGTLTTRSRTLCKKSASLRCPFSSVSVFSSIFSFPASSLSNSFRATIKILSANTCQCFVHLQRTAFHLRK